MTTKRTVRHGGVCRTNRDYSHGHTGKGGCVSVYTTESTDFGVSLAPPWSVLSMSTFSNLDRTDGTAQHYSRKEVAEACHSHGGQSHE